MPPIPPALAYRRAAAQQASVVGLVIALYDTLAGDLQRAVVAMRDKNLEERSAQLKHGFTVLIQLNTLLDFERGGQTALNLQRFYEHMRRQMLQAQFSQDASVLERVSALLLDVRGAWQEVDTRTAVSGNNASQTNSGKTAGSELRTLNCMA